MKNPPMRLALTVGPDTRPIMTVDEHGNVIYGKPLANEERLALLRTAESSGSDTAGLTAVFTVLASELALAKGRWCERCQQTHALRDGRWCKGCGDELKGN